MDHVWIGAVLTAVAFRGLAWPISPADFWWQTAVGRWIVENGALPTADTFSWTRLGEPFFDQPWLSQVALFGLWRGGSANGSLLAVAVLLLLTQGQLLRQAIHRSGHVQAASVLVLLSLPAQMTNWELRSQLLVLPIFALAFAELDRWRAGEQSTLRTAAVLVPCMTLWVNLHGSFPLGLVLAALFGAGRLWEATAEVRSRVLGEDLALGLALALATCIHPHGPTVWVYVLTMLGDSGVQHQITEWAAPTPTDPVGAIFFGTAALVAGLGALAARVGRVTLFEVAVVGAFGALALTSVRHILWFGMVSTPIAATWLAAVWTLPEDDDRTGSVPLNAAMMGVYALIVGLMLPPVKVLLPLPVDLRMPVDSATPVSAVLAIQALPETPKRLFHSEESGSYLMYAAPEIPVFIDARVELYPAEQIADFQALSRAENVDELVARYRFDGMLLDKERFEPLVAWVAASGTWEQRYEDERFAYWTPIP